MLVLSGIFFYMRQEAENRNFTYLLVLNEWNGVVLFGHIQVQE
jgi:hypothetical protein